MSQTLEKKNFLTQCYVLLTYYVYPISRYIMWSNYSTITNYI